MRKYTKKTRLLFPSLSSEQALLATYLFGGKCCDVISSWWKSKMQETVESLSKAASWDGQAAEKNSLLLFELPYIFSKFLNRPQRTIHRMPLKTGYPKKCWFCFLVKVATVGEDDLRFWSCWCEPPASRPLWCVKGNAKKLWTDIGKTIQIWSFSSCNFLGSIHFFFLEFFSTFSGSFILFILFGSISLLKSNAI